MTAGTPSNQTAAVGGHTPLPWALEERDYGEVAIITARTAAQNLDKGRCWDEQSTILLLNDSEAEQSGHIEANAALIVRAVNSHKALVELIGHFLRCQDEGDGLYDCVDNFEQPYQSADLASVIERARDSFAALQHAEAGGHE